jgi:plasmid stabilization system protein ParE
MTRRPRCRPTKKPASKQRSNRTVRGVSSTPSAPERSSTQTWSVEVTYTEEAVADIVQTISYLNERNPTAAANLDTEIARCIERLADREFDGPVSRLGSGTLVRSWGVPPFRIYYQRRPDELLIVRVYHQARRPITR